MNYRVTDMNNNELNECDLTHILMIGIGQKGYVTTASGFVIGKLTPCVSGGNVKVWHYGRRYYARYCNNRVMK